MRVTSLKLEHFAGPTSARGDFHISGDFREDVASAVREDHCCNDSACDIAAAMEADCPLSAAYLLYGATECPALDAVRFAYSLRPGGIPTDFARGVTPDWEDWQAYHAKYGRECEECGSYTYGDDYWTPEECGNCLTKLRTLDEVLSD